MPSWTPILVSFGARARARARARDRDRDRDRDRVRGRRLGAAAYLTGG